MSSIIKILILLNQNNMIGNITYNGQSLTYNQQNLNYGL